MPFKSKAQMRGAFSGALGPEMKKKAPQWAAETPNPKGLPNKVKAKPPATSKKKRKNRGDRPVPMIGMM